MEVTRLNFFELLPEIESAIENCAFLAVDLELSGLCNSLLFKNSLFDTAAGRYDKIRNRTNGIIATQVGLSTFKFNRDENNYTSNTYTFHLRPHSIGGVAQYCTFEASALDFLTENSFDFNKIMYTGIPFLNKNEVTLIQNNLKSQELDSNLGGCDIDLLMGVIMDIKNWMSTNETTFVMKNNMYLSPLIVQKVHKTYPNVNIKFENGGVIFTKTKNGVQNREEINKEIEKFAMGFTNVIQLICETKKPIVFHNAFFDLIIIYQQFIEKLPASYSKFKKNLNRIFPEIYDTKYLFDLLRPQLRGEPIANNTSLSNVYNFFLEDVKAQSLGLFPPAIKMNENFDANPKFHHAGWDAYSTGFIFIRIAYAVLCLNIGSHKKSTTVELLTAVSPSSNLIFLGRANQPYLSIDKVDPPSHRPQFLHVQFLLNNPFDIRELATNIGRFESVDVKRYGKNAALVAVTNKFSAKRILDNFKNDKSLRVSRYNIFRHSLPVRICLWSGVALCSGSMIAYLIAKTSK